jgi:hypothetical protein
MTYFESLGVALTGTLNQIIAKLNISLKEVRILEEGGDVKTALDTDLTDLHFKDRHGVNFIYDDPFKSVSVDITDAISGLATTSYVNNQIDALVGSAPGALDTLGELADALNDDANVATNLTNQINLRATKTYVDSQLATKANTTYVDTELAKKVNSSTLGTVTDFNNGMSGLIAIV